MSATTAPILRISNVSKRFMTAHGEVAVLRDITFDVRPGEIISVIGPSGCGKTTLFNIIGGLLDDYEGSVLFAGKPRAVRRQIGMVFQEESNFPWRTTLENVAFPLEAAGVARRERLERARRFVRLVGLGGFEDHYPDQLSGGMRQRAALARTLAYGPEILLMDEPFAALDSQPRLLIGDKVLEISQKLRQTMLVITHNLTEAVQLSDRVVVLTARPARVKRLVEIDLPRPRSSEIVGTDQFAHLLDLIWKELRDEAISAMAHEVQRLPDGAPDV